MPPNKTIAPGPTAYTFAYDDLDGCACGCENQRRFTVANTYDALGNLTRKAQNDVIQWPSGRIDTQLATSYDIAYSYAPAKPHAPTNVGGQAMTYDADGNLKSSTGTFGPARTFTWNEEDQRFSP